jgi:ribose 5-phosphate isomerase B
MNKEKITIVLASDHAGFALKNSVKEMLEKEGYKILDVGAHTLVPEDDYPVYISAGALKVAEDLSGDTKAIIFGGSGQGEAIVANRFPGVRAVVWYGDSSNSELNIIKLSREHNDANVLSIGARFVSESDAIGAVKLWLMTDFSNEDKHLRRINLIDSIQ